MREHDSTFKFHLVYTDLQVRKTKADWLPSAVLVDACDAEIAAVKQAFTLAVAVFLCHWHVQKAWKKQLYAKVYYSPHADSQKSYLHLKMWY